ncbi:MAG: ATP-binding protein [Synechococcus sp. SB0669_bin_7]|nr:ATP-binding protein [Synechococcus sp. SB0669_bin_7]
MEDTDIPPLLATFKGHPKYLLPWITRREYTRLSMRKRLWRMMDDDNKQSPEKLNCVSIGPNLPNNEDLVEFIDKVALTEEDHKPKEALGLILEDDMYGIAVIGRGEKSRPRVMVKLSEQEPRAPLRSLGDGATRFFGIAAGLLKSRDGILLIDEVENGIHYSVHERL